MRASKDMLLREIAGEHILVPVGEAAARFQGMITLNGSGLLLWERLGHECTEEDLATALMDEYEVDLETAREDVRKFLAKMEQAGILEKD